MLNGLVSTLLPTFNLGISKEFLLQLLKRPTTFRLFHSCLAELIWVLNFKVTSLHVRSIEISLYATGLRQSLSLNVDTFTYSSESALRLPRRKYNYIFHGHVVIVCSCYDADAVLIAVGITTVNSLFIICDVYNGVCWSFHFWYHTL